MAELYDDERVVDAAPGDDRGVWFEDVVLIHGDIKGIYGPREISHTFDRVHQYAPNWHIVNTYQYQYTVTNNATLIIPVFYPVGSEISEIGCDVTGGAAAAAGSMDFEETDSDGTVATTIDIDGGAANPWNTGGTAFGNLTRYSQNTAHGSIPLEIKQSRWYQWKFTAANNAAANECRIWHAYVIINKGSH